MENIINPILQGFNPDPSIIRVKDDYYIATSTFEWYPGVQIHHSKNLRDWELLPRPLNRPEQLDMRGNPDSGGVWAPCLSYADDKFWLVYSDVKRFNGSFLDVKNYIVYADSIEGPWSDPIFVNSGGFDPSLFHDNDGSKYFMNMEWEHTNPDNRFNGIILQEFSIAERKLIGDAKNIFKGTELKITEAPHIYRRNGYYYLITAEGGTSRDHAMTMARAKSIWGDYELHPNKYIVTTKDAPDNYLQRCGHGDIVDAPDGTTYAVFLCGRPVTSNKRCILGRETAIDRMEWKNDDWLYLANGTQVPDNEVECKDQEKTPNYPEASECIYNFNTEALPLDFQWLRTPFKDRIFTLTERKGYLRLYGKESVGSWFEQSLVARRQTTFKFTATTVIDYQPKSFQQYAGLICYYNRSKYHYLAITHDPQLGRVIQIISCKGDYLNDQVDIISKTRLPAEGEIGLRAAVDNDDLEFSFKTAGEEWQKLGGTLDMTIVSDEGGRGEHHSFTGAFTGMACSDLTGKDLPADFSNFTYTDK